MPVLPSRTSPIALQASMIRGGLAALCGTLCTARYERPKPGQMNGQAEDRLQAERIAQHAQTAGRAKCTACTSCRAQRALLAEHGAQPKGEVGEHGGGKAGPVEGQLRGRGSRHAQHDGHEAGQRGSWGGLAWGGGRKGKKAREGLSLGQAVPTGEVADTPLLGGDTEEPWPCTSSWDAQPAPCSLGRPAPPPCSSKPLLAVHCSRAPSMSMDSPALKAGSRVLTVCVSESATATKLALEAMWPTACCREADSLRLAPGHPWAALHAACAGSHLHIPKRQQRCPLQQASGSC